MGAHGKHGVEEQHALLRPGDEAAVPRRRDPEIVLQFLVNVQQ